MVRNVFAFAACLAAAVSFADAPPKAAPAESIPGQPAPSQPAPAGESASSPAAQQAAVPAPGEPSPSTPAASAPPAEPPATAAASPPASAAPDDQPAQPQPADAAAPTPPGSEMADSAQPTGEDGDRPDLNLAPLDEAVRLDIEQQIKTLEDAGLSDADKQQALKFCQQALESFTVANQQLTAAREYEKKLSTLEADTDFEETRLKEPLKPYDSVDGLTLAEVEERSATVESSLKVYRAWLAELEAEPKRRSNRLAALPKEIADVDERLKKTSEDLAALGGEDVKDALTLARRTALSLAKQRLAATLKALNREQRLYQQGGNYIKFRRDHYARYVPYKEKRLAQLRQEINRRRESEASQQAQQAARQTREAAKATANRPKFLARMAADNEALAKRRAEIARSITQVSQELIAANDRLADLSKRFKIAEDQVRIAELSDLSGELLRREQSTLPRVHQLKRRAADRNAERADVLIQIYVLNDKRSELANIDDLMERLAAKYKRLKGPVRDEVRKLLEAKRAYLDDLITDSDAYSKSLNELDSIESQLVRVTEEYSAFIAQRVLWIRSASPIGPADISPAIEAGRWSLAFNHWLTAASQISALAAERPLSLLAGVAALAALALVQAPARRRLQLRGQEAANRTCTRLGPTIEAVWLTVVISLPWPALLALTGWAVGSPRTDSEFVRALSFSLEVAALCLLLFAVLRHLCRPGGLAEAHFEWPVACLVEFRRRLRWLTAFALPLIWWLVVCEVQATEPQYSASLGRACFVVVMLLSAGVLERLLLSRGNPFQKLVLYTERGWLMPLQVTWRPAAVLLPAVLAGLAAVGYYYTALQASMRLLQTVSLVLAVLVLGGFTRRWLLVSRRQLAREQARQRRAQLAAAAEADADAPPPLEISDELIDLAAVSQQTQKLVRTFLALTTTVGILLIWAEILPALAYLGQAQLIPSAEATDNYTPLTWGQLFTVLAILIVTFVSVRDVPALLELLVLQHLPLDGGFRYALTSICRYVLAAVGLTLAFNGIGLHWSDVQWLVAAMSVGLGFGLQEIFANFVSGIILLFERPIRVGDIVTLGDKSGVVNRIRMRATTLVDWDRKEYIVPNKDLVTGRLLNWTLSDQMNRIEIIVNVAHGADTDAACALLLEAAREQPHLLNEPAPSAVFEGLSEAGLKLALRCFLPTLEYRGATIHQLYTAIDRKFRTANIELAAPPRELRMRLVREDGQQALDARRIA